MTWSPKSDDSVHERENELRSLVDASVREAATRLREKYPDVGTTWPPFGTTDQVFFAPEETP